MKKLITVSALILISYISFSQIIVYESEKWVSFEISGENYFNKTSIQDSCRLILSSYCEGGNNGLIIDLKYDNIWHMLIGNILDAGKDFIDPETNKPATSYQLQFLADNDLINGINYKGSSYSMIFDERPIIFIASGKNGIAIMNAKVKIEH